MCLVHFKLGYVMQSVFTECAIAFTFLRVRLMAGEPLPLPGQLT